MVNFNKFLLLVANVLLLFSDSNELAKKSEHDEIIETVKIWADEVSKELTHLTQLTRRKRVKESFAHVNVIEETWEEVVESVANNIREMMVEKVEAVKAIKSHAELLSYHQKDPINMYSSYDYYDAVNLTQTDNVTDRTEDMLETEHMWRCSIPQNSQGLCFGGGKERARRQSDDSFPDTFEETIRDFDSFNYKRHAEQRLRETPRTWGRCSRIAFLKRPLDYYRSMNMVYNPQVDTDVNMNYSIVRVSPGLDPRKTNVLNGIRWSEGLDLTFKCNFQKDPTLTYQYFGSPSGFMRFYPAMQWSDEEYDQTFDFRVRSWFVEGMASAKDIVILVDRSGSMKGINRLITTQIVNSILDTLTDNDYVNIYTFTNTSEHLVSCFNDTLVQANEENLRLFREHLDGITNEFYGDISWGLEKAFPLLWKYREVRGNHMVCNQAIMLITEGLDYEYNDKLFKMYNYLPAESTYYRPIRIFTYLLGTEPSDAQRMKWIACANMGYYVNVSSVAEVREKVLKYLEVMSRPINLSPKVEAEPVWTALYVHLADRRLSNWLWKKNEGNRQRDIYIKYEKEQLEKRKITPHDKHFTLETEHAYKQYLAVREYRYLTSVSLPVYDRRPNKTSLLGVAGVDVPLDYIKQLSEPHRIGVNGYSFIITNNGYVLYHPDHRTEFKDRILKPTFNRVDFTEVEISDDTVVPRKFDDAIVELRRNIVLQHKGHRLLKVRTPFDDMRRVMLSSRHYFYTALGPFSLGIALPDKYGSLVIRYNKADSSTSHRNTTRMLKGNRNWRVHPNWLYTCKTHRVYKSPELQLLAFLEQNKKPPENCSTDLIEALAKDLKVTEWFDVEDSSIRNFRSKYLDGMVLAFMATHAGLTRWKDFIVSEAVDKHFANVHNTAADEVYYRRSAEINYDDPDMFIYSVPFANEEYNINTTLITASNVVFKEKEDKKAPVAAVGFQVFHRTLNAMLGGLKCKSKLCHLSCTEYTWTCYVLDNDAYIVLAEDTKLVGKSISKVDNTLTFMMVKDAVYKEITVFDYQATCYPNYYTISREIRGLKAADVVGKEVDCKTKMKCKTIEYLRRQLQKTTPTPCDEELKMYNSLYKNHAFFTVKNQKGCNCPYITQHIKGTNLMFVAVNGTCCHTDEVHVPRQEYPRQIMYNQSLPCYVAIMNNFTKRHYTKCVIKNEKEYVINADNQNCGGEGIVPIE